MHRDGTVPSRKKHRDGTVPSRKKHSDGTVPSRKKYHDGTVEEQLLYDPYHTEFISRQVNYVCLFNRTKKRTYSEKCPFRAKTTSSAKCTRDLL